MNTLEKLALDSDKYVRTGVARHPNTPVNTLEKLALDSDEHVRRGVADHPNTPVGSGKYVVKLDIYHYQIFLQEVYYTKKLLRHTR